MGKRGVLEKYGKDADSSAKHTSYAPVMIEMSLVRGVLTPITDDISFEMDVNTIIEAFTHGRKE